MDPSYPHPCMSLSRSTLHLFHCSLYPSNVPFPLPAPSYLGLLHPCQHPRLSHHHIYPLLPVSLTRPRLHVQPLILMLHPSYIHVPRTTFIIHCSRYPSLPESSDPLPHLSSFCLAPVNALGRDSMLMGRET
ncbi:hypothetical protein E2C01_061519 [Portunus trituberculatus]|uniref:Uncharacterized protein n=1 Tax=Portunus trituberculatus TaxID=210409 RepID=A0A5B7HF92_PORTR|nr:hypothetical protein [Portunus trituberculatus]